MFVGSEKSDSKRPLRLLFKHVIRKVFLEDWVMKLVALAITLGLWLGVTGLSTPTTRRFSAVPLTILISNDAAITNAFAQEVEIVVSGDKRKVDQINKSEVAVQLDLSEAPPGERVVSLTPQTVSVLLPLGVKLDEILPGRIAINLEAVEQKEVEVKAVTDGAPAVGFEIYSETILPQKVRVRGPASFIRTLDFVTTDKISIAGKQEDFTARQVAVGVSNPKATVLDTGVVDVAFRIGEKRVERIFLVPVTGTSGKKAAVVLYGPKTILSGVKAENLKIEMLRNDAGEESPSLILPDALQGNVEIRSIKIRA